MTNENSAIRIIVRVKRYSIKTIVDNEINISIIIYLILKRLQFEMKSADRNQIIIVD